MKRGNIVKEAKIIHVVVFALLFLSGVCLLFWSDINTTAVRYLVAVNFRVIGAARVLGYFANDLYRLAFQHDFAMGTFCAILGVLICFCPAQALKEALPYVMGVYALLDGLLKLQTAFDARGFGMRQWIGLLISSAFVSLCGIFVLVGFSSFEKWWLIGVALTVDGAENIWNTMGTVRIRAKKENRYTDEL